ncbi:MAG: universal stress protein [Proteobacteria bacterium]|nr:universal stress protein [Pseudomonadota bacterium]
MYKIILHATDLSENHYQICQEAIELAKYFNAELHLLHVLESPTSYQLAQGLGFAELIAPVKEDAIAVMKILGESLNIPVKQQHVEVGSIKNSIFDMVRELNANLIIIGNHSQNRLADFLGNTAQAIIRHAPCDVLTLRGNLKS